MQDIIEVIGKNTVIQHGEHNKRIYLISLDEQDINGITSRLNALAREASYTKIFCKVPAWAAPVFNADGYVMEAFVPGFYQGQEGACFMSKFLNSDRLLGIENEQLEEFSSLLQHRSGELDSGTTGGSDYSPVELGEESVEEIAGVYRQVFKSYPFPIHDPGYIVKTMNEHIRYFGIREHGKLIALSSAETDRKGKNAEMTDFATLPQARGKKLSSVLLAHMEQQMTEEGMLTLYTIARLNSIPMNRTFLRHGYAYSGTLINNTNISGSIESMNVLYKHIERNE